MKKRDMVSHIPRLRRFAAELALVRTWATCRIKKRDHLDPSFVHSGAGITLLSTLTLNFHVDLHECAVFDKAL